MDAPHHVVGTSQAEQELYFAEKFSDKTKSALDILNRVPVEKICSKGKVQHVTTKDNLYAFTDLCISEHIQSAPIHNVEKQSHRAFIDVIDVVAHTLDVYNKVKADKNWEEGRKLWEAKNCQELADHSKRDPFSPVGEETPLLDVIEKFIKFKAHRLPIIDGAGELVHLISQLRVVEVLEKHIGKFKCATTTVKALQLGYKDCVYSVKESEAVATGFQTMLEHHVSGLAVLDAGGKVVGNLSATDMKHVASDRKVDLSQLELSVKDFCEAISKNTDPKLIPGVICVRPSTTIEELVFKFVLTKVHRIYVIDDNDVLLGIISTVDVLRQLIDAETGKCPITKRDNKPHHESADLDL